MNAMQPIRGPESLYKLNNKYHLKENWTNMHMAFMSNSIENYKINWKQTFQLILLMHFSFMRYFVNSIISKVSHKPLCWIFIEVDFEK